jgi:hypothetical protein
MKSLMDNLTAVPLELNQLNPLPPCRASLRVVYPPKTPVHHTSTLALVVTSCLFRVLVLA